MIADKCEGGAFSLPDEQMVIFEEAGLYFVDTA
jgi:hypothetical protein